MKTDSPVPSNSDLNRRAKQSLKFRDSSLFQALLDSAPGNYIASEGHHILHWCWEAENKWAWPAALSLIRQGADVNRHGGPLKELLLFRCLDHQSPRLDRLDNILALGARVDVVNAWGRPPLSMAAANKLPVAFIERLLQAGAHLNALNQRRETALFSQPSLEVAKCLVEAGADIHHAGSEGCTPLMAAAYSFRDDLVTYLISVGARVNQVDHNGDTALHCVFSRGSSPGRAVVMTLLLSGADLNIRNSKGLTPIGAAVHNRHMEYVELLENWQLAQVAADAVGSPKTFDGFAPL